MYCLSWNSYKNNLSNGFAELQQREEFVDMTLVAEGHQVKVHKMLVSLASPYIKNVIKSVPCTHPIIFLTNITQKVLGQLLEYIYTGQVYVETVDLNAFVKAATELQLPGIVNDLSHSTSSKKEKLNSVPKTYSKKHALDNCRKLELGSGDAKISTNDIVNIDDIEMAPVDNSNNSFAKTLNKEKVNKVSKTNPTKKYQPLDNKKLKRNNGEAINNIALVTENPPGDNDNNPLARILINAQSKNTSEILPSSNYLTTSNSLQIFDNRKLNLDNGKAVNSNMVTEIPPANNDDNNPLARILISKQSRNTPQALPTSNHLTTSNSLQILDNRLLDFGVSKNAPETDNLKNIPEKNASSQNQTPSSDNPANHFDEFLKLLDPPKSTVEEIGSTSQSQQLQLIDPRNEETKANLSLDLGTKILPQKYSLSSRGSLQLILHRYIYSMQYSADGDVKRRWLCLDYCRKQCPAYVDTENDQITNSYLTLMESYMDIGDFLSRTSQLFPWEMSEMQGTND